MAIEAVAAAAVKEVAVQAAREAVTQVAREIAQKMAAEASAQSAGSEMQTAMMERQAMQEGFRIGEMPETNGEGRGILKQMELNTADELRGKLDAEETQPASVTAPETESPEVQNTVGAEEEQQETTQEITKSQDAESVHLPQTNGKWEGDEGNSKWIPESDYVPQKNNPEGMTWGEIMGREKIDGISYRDGEPDFSEVARDTVEIDDFGTDRNENFSQADEKLSGKWNQEAKDGKTDWTPRDVANYRRENGLTWHERSDMRTMDLVPRDVHNNMPHSGGISVAKHLPESAVPGKQALWA